MFGVTTPCVQQIAAELSKDWECLVFHATGVGGQSMEKLADSGLLAGVIDITTTEVCDLLMGGVFPATEDRFGAFVRTRLPYVGSVGALDMVNFGPRDTVPPAYAGRRLQVHNPQVTLMRTTPAENDAMGRWIGERLNRMDGPVRFLLPEGGVSALDAPGQPFHDPEADAALFRALDQTVRQTTNRQLIRVKRHINDPEFAAAVDQRVSRAARARRHPQARGEVVMPGIDRKTLLDKFRAMVARGEPIVGGGAGTGLSAKCEEDGGADLIVIYNSGRYRMAGRGSLAGLLAYGDANAIVVDMAREVLPVVKRTPVLAGVNGTDPFRQMDVFLDEIKALGFSGVQNFPTVGLIDGTFRANLEETGMSYALEVEMIAMARAQGPADHALRLQRIRGRGDGAGRRRHHRLPHGPDHRRQHRRADRAQARGLPCPDRRLGRRGAAGAAGHSGAGAWRADRGARRRGFHHEEHEDLPRILRRVLDGAAAGRARADRAGADDSRPSAETGSLDCSGRPIGRPDWEGSEDVGASDRQPDPVADHRDHRHRGVRLCRELALPSLVQGGRVRPHRLHGRTGGDRRRRLRAAVHPRFHARST